MDGTNKKRHKKSDKNKALILLINKINNINNINGKNNIKIEIKEESSNSEEKKRR